MTHADLEVVYEALAQQLDIVGEERANLYLVKLALLLSKQCNESAPVLEAITAAARSLEV